MSDIMYPMPFSHLMSWALDEYRTSKTIFGVRNFPQYAPGSGVAFYDERIEMPIGPAAGPNSQLAQNLLASYVAGARFFELKTVQVVDGADLSAMIPKPCIAPGLVCYNCEWSTELTCEQARDEYIRGWWACKLFSRELGLGADDGFVFNMSVGYTLEGVKSPKVDGFLNDMKDASKTAAWQECREWTLAHLDDFEHVDRAFVDSISPHVATSLTMSTMHGCPAGDIEAIAQYLIAEKDLNLCVKVNPTLPGYDFVRNRLDNLGYDELPLKKESFEHDLQWSDAAPMLRRLKDFATEHGKHFGVKVTNTLPVGVAYHELPSDEMYMAGIALYPLAIAVSEMIAREFDGNIHISFSAGVDEKNVAPLCNAGIWPVTVATSILRPNGYERLGKMAKAIDVPETLPHRTVDIDAIAGLNRLAGESDAYKRPHTAQSDRQLSAELPLIDCIACRHCCVVCPNRANVTVDVPNFKRKQILHIDGMCNECGNCAVFCPYIGRPYRDKLTVFWEKEHMDNSKNDGILLRDDGTLLVRYEGKTVIEDPRHLGCNIPEDLAQIIAATYKNYRYLMKPTRA